MKRIFIEDLHNYLEKEVLICGWVHIRRDQGKMIFLEIRDMTSKVQAVALPTNKEALSTADKLRPEWVVSIKGKVSKRPEKNINKNQENGDIEIEIFNIEILNEAETPPFDIHGPGTDIEEEIRLKYRYIDLRRERLQKNIKTRALFIKKCREFLEENKFLEIETPLLTKATPEGSRDFLVPSRLHKGKYYALPQSPQQYKELLMAAGFERYYQIARALRDEDLRADRGFEHTQIDMEMAFVEMEDVMKTTENMVIKAVESMGYTIKDKPFPIITYKEAIEKYGKDKFDLRTKEEKNAGVLAYAWVIDFPSFEKTEEGNYTFSHNPFSAPKNEYLEDLLQGKNIDKIISQQYDLVCNGFEVGGGSIRAHKPEILKATYKIMGYTDEQIEESVGHMLKAYGMGMPPHGGIALGVERNVMILTGEKYLREVQAFPMTRGGKTSVVDAPTEFTSEK